MRYLLDTNTCIYIIKRAPESVYRHFRTLRIGDVGVSAVTYCELEFGIANSSRPEKNRLALMEFLAPLEVLDFPAAAATVYGSIRAHLQKKGKPIGNYDLLLAAHALHAGLIMVTNNVKEFKRVANLQVENWIQ